MQFVIKEDVWANSGGGPVDTLIDVVVDKMLSDADNSYHEKTDSVGLRG